MSSGDTFEILNSQLASLYHSSSSTRTPEASHHRQSPTSTVQLTQLGYPPLHCAPMSCPRCPVDFVCKLQAFKWTGEQSFQPVNMHLPAVCSSSTTASDIMTPVTATARVVTSTVAAANRLSTPQASISRLVCIHSAVDITGMNQICPSRHRVH
jgi:hypothetical protein